MYIIGAYYEKDDLNWAWSLNNESCKNVVLEQVDKQLLTNCALLAKTILITQHFDSNFIV